MKHLLMIMLLSSCLALIACGGGKAKDEGTEEKKTEAAGTKAKTGETAKADAVDEAASKSYNVSFKVGTTLYNEGTVYVVHSEDKSQTLVVVKPTSGSGGVCAVYEGGKAVKSSKSVGNIASVEKTGDAISVKGTDGKSIPLSLQAGSVTPPSFDTLNSQCVYEEKKEAAATQ